jgi:tRNA-Thr(GGU) m(6)t(6)A37 methyltransferase TsaA
MLGKINDMNINPIAIFHSPLSSKFGIPRQSGLANELKGYIVFESKYRNPDALRGLEEIDYIWLLWEFSANKRGKAIAGEIPANEITMDWQPTVRPPRLGGNKSMGVFATRSPFRPNPIGLSSVKVESIELETPQGPVIHTLGADLMDGTPILDIKPYITYADCHPEAKCGFVDSLSERTLHVEIPTTLYGLLSEEEWSVLKEILSLDPRPAYQNDPQKVYGLPFGGHDIHFQVEGKVLTVIGIV